jgi:hypothetical protein
LTISPTAAATATQTPSAASISGVVAGNGAGTYVFTGTGTPGDTVYVTVNGSAVPGSATVQPDGTWSLSASTTVPPGATIAAHSGSATGPSGSTQTAGPAATVAITGGTLPIAGGATVIDVNGTAGQVVTVIDPSTGRVLGTGTVPATGPAAIILTTPANPGETLQLVVDGMAGPTLATVGPAGAAPALIQGTVLVEGSVITAQGSPGATIQVVDAQGRVLGSAVADAAGVATITVSGAVAGVAVKLVQDGVSTDLPSPAVQLGNQTAFINSNVFKPLLGGSLDIGFKATQDDQITVKIFNVAGETVRLVAFMDVKAGVLYGLRWNGKNDYDENVAAGLYVISISGGKTHVLKKVIVLK